MGANPRAVPHRRLVFDRHVAYDRRCGRDERGFGNGRFASLELEQWHWNLPDSNADIMTNRLMLAGTALLTFAACTSPRPASTPAPTPSIAPTPSASASGSVSPAVAPSGSIAPSVPPV